MPRILAGLLGLALGALALPAAAIPVYPDVADRVATVTMSWSPGPSGMVTRMRTVDGTRVDFGTLTGGVTRSSDRLYRIEFLGAGTSDDTGFTFTLDRYTPDGALARSVSWNFRYCFKTDLQGRVRVDGVRRDCPAVELRNPWYFGDNFGWRLVGHTGYTKVFEEGEPYPAIRYVGTGAGSYVFTVTPSSPTSSGGIGVGFAPLPVPAAGLMLAPVLLAGLALGRRRAAG